MTRGRQLSQPQLLRPHPDPNSLPTPIPSVLNPSDLNPPTPTPPTLTPRPQSSDLNPPSPTPPTLTPRPQTPRPQPPRRQLPQPQLPDRRRHYTRFASNRPRVELSSCQVGRVKFVRVKLSCSEGPIPVCSGAHFSWWLFPPMPTSPNVHRSLSAHLLWCPFPPNAHLQRRPKKLGLSFWARRLRNPICQLG